jgi:AmiR/NasT family two-component response regulator
MISFRNRKAAILCPDDKDRSLLAARLARLGLIVEAQTDWSPGLTAWRPDVVFFDVDSGCGNLADQIGPDTASPLIAIVGAETPGRLDWMMRQRPAAYLLRPIRSSGVYTALIMGFNHVHARDESLARIDRLERRAQARRVIFAATTRLMTEEGLTEPAAYRLLRDAAMRHRTTIEDVSARIEADGTFEIAARAKS